MLGAGAIRVPAPFGFGDIPSDQGEENAKQRKLGGLAAVFVLCAIGAANASAAQFTASATGSFEGKALSNQVFTTNAGTVTCSTAATTGTIQKPLPPSRTSPSVHLLNDITITPQTVSTSDFANGVLIA